MNVLVRLQKQYGALKASSQQRRVDSTLATAKAAQTLLRARRLLMRSRKHLAELRRKRSQRAM
jgi:hypothetical protein